MADHELKIIISGESGSGKTLLAFALQSLLKENGWIVLLCDSDESDHEYFSDVKSEALARIKGRALIECVQTTREITEVINADVRPNTIVLWSKDSDGYNLLLADGHVVVIRHVDSDEENKWLVEEYHGTIGALPWDELKEDEDIWTLLSDCKMGYASYASANAAFSQFYNSWLKADSAVPLMGLSQISNAVIVSDFSEACRALKDAPGQGTVECKLYQWLQESKQL